MKRTYQCFDTRQMEGLIATDVSGAAILLFLSICNRADKRNLVRLGKRPYKRFSMSKGQFSKLTKHLSERKAIRRISLCGDDYIMVNPNLRWAGEITEKKYWNFVFNNGAFPDDQNTLHNDEVSLSVITIEDYPIELDSSRPIVRVGDTIVYTDTGEIACVLPKLLVDTSPFETNLLRKYDVERQSNLANVKSSNDEQSYVDELIHDLRILDLIENAA